MNWSISRDNRIISKFSGISPIMPNAQSTQMELHSFGMRSKPHKLPSTKDMVDEAIFELTSARGFSLIKLKKYISDKYQIDITPQRYALIKHQLHVQMTNGVLINVTGRGLIGRLKLQSKESFRKSNLPKGYHTTIKRKKPASKENKSKAKSDMVVPGTPGTPTNNHNHPTILPQAPLRNSVMELSQFDLLESTPCSSGGKRKGLRRQIIPNPCSQVF